MKESEDPESTRDFRVVSGRVSEVRKRVSESGFERVEALSDEFRMREFNAILGSCGVSRTAQSFFASVPEDTDLSCSVLEARALEEAEVDFGQSLATCPEMPQKRHSLLSRRRCRS